MQYKTDKLYADELTKNKFRRVNLYIDTSCASEFILLYE